MAHRSLPGATPGIRTNVNDQDRAPRFDLDVIDDHFAWLRGDIDVAEKAVHAAQAVLKLVDALKKEGALVEGVELDYFAVLRTILKDANGMLTAAGVEWDEVESAMGPLGYDQDARARAMEAANG